MSAIQNLPFAPDNKGRPFWRPLSFYTKFEDEICSSEEVGKRHSAGCSFGYNFVELNIIRFQYKLPVFYVINSR